jgi:hypothetical protein
MLRASGPIPVLRRKFGVGREGRNEKAPTGDVWGRVKQ